MQNEHDIGYLKGRLEAQDERLERIEQKLDTALDFVSGQKGAWKILTVLGVAASAVGAGIMTVFNSFFGGSHQ